MTFSRLLVTAVATFCLAGSARATLYWEALTNNGTGVFEGLEQSPGIIGVASDPLGQFGNVYQYHLTDTYTTGKERCESRGTRTNGNNFRLEYTNEYYIGWRAMWNPMPINGSWVALFQMHGYGVTGQGAPLVLRCVNGDGNLYMQNGANGVNTNFWHTPFKTNVWQTFVLHVFLSTNPAEGYTEIWYDGVLQTNNAGTTRWYGPTWDNVDGNWQDSYNLLKWGCYRSGSLDGHGDAFAYMSEAKVGSTYADVDPSGGGDFSMTTTPSSQIVAPGAGTNYTVSISPIGGFSTNVDLSAIGLPAGAS
ncbi:MAG: heparin lyase I family protein, partial [Verrucomicrobiota bacterium]|nr:heparin lyase I family protein [Verrucomicrobiota bacterium]